MDQQRAVLPMQKPGARLFQVQAHTILFHAGPLATDRNKSCWLQRQTAQPPPSPMNTFKVAESAEHFADYRQLALK
jgi:hypothetical protein